MLMMEKAGSLLSMLFHQNMFNKKMLYRKLQRLYLVKSRKLISLFLRTTSANWTQIQHAASKLHKCPPNWNKRPTGHIAHLRNSFNRLFGCMKLAQWFWRSRFLNFINVFSLIRYYLLLEKSGALHVNKLTSLHLSKFLC